MSSMSPVQQLRYDLIQHPDFMGIEDAKRQACKRFAVLAAALTEANPPDSEEIETAYARAVDEARSLATQGLLVGLVLPDSAVEPAPPSEAETDDLAKTEPEFPHHPVAELFPMMSPEELAALADDIKKSGLNEPVVLFEGKVIDGRNRLAACQLAGVEPHFRQWDGRGSLVGYVVSGNLHRRHLSDHQRTIVAAKARGALEQEARGRRADNLLQNKDSTESRDPGFRELGKSAAQVASTFDVSTDSVERASKVLKKGDESLVAALEAKAVSLDAAAEVATLPKAKQRQVVEAGKVKEAAKAIRLERRATRKASSASEVSLPEAGEAQTEPDQTAGAAAQSEPEQTTEAEPEPTTDAQGGTEPEPTADAEDEPQPTTTPTSQAKPTSQLSQVLHRIREKGPAVARKVITKIAADAGLTVWVATDDPSDDLSTLGVLLCDRLQIVAERDPEEAECWVQSHHVDLQEATEAAGGIEDDGESDFDE